MKMEGGPEFSNVLSFQGFVERLAWHFLTNIRKDLELEPSLLKSLVKAAL